VILRPAWIILALTLAHLVAGCAAVAPPAPTTLPFPERPALRFYYIEAAGAVCTNVPDASALATYFDELDAFAHAWHRLQ